ncbi:lipocalin [Flavobacteriaceae bacterium R38]|nr:lipocalin [Flavobacteriaceae bacterium R38]
MKKTIATALILMFIISGCGSTKTIRESKKTLKGNWTVDNISYSETGTFNVTLFDDVSAECMKGSIWRFIPNNNFGNYEINSGGGSSCATGTRYFVWSIPNSDVNYDVLLKPTNEKKKSVLNNKGYRLGLTYLSETQLKLTQTVQLEGKPFIITINFSKL